MEMISKDPTSLTPTLKFEDAGLEAETEYDVSLTMEKLDSKRYGFDKKTQHWEESKKRSSKEFHIPESIGRIRYGKDLDLHFESIKISSRSRDQNLENVVYVQTMQKYVPVITITNLASKETVAHVVLEMAQFIPVTIYQDQSIGKWKAQHNKYATVRYGGKGMEQKKKEKTQEPILEDNSNFRQDPISRVLEVDKILNSSSPVNAVPQVCSQYPMMP
ncbi:Protein CBG20004 [Caenorhabditis briggsae]|uniref:Protein CBG20004 n=2 Tax=Caenorhabditis briggsae TaxID=6238 RepID=A8XWW9_CAEBR|nr:Protein CBG20004 [Caenorhabditis briggsae]CAP37138.2 Protein CBG20004 [Caenorhabditis briggsae]